MGTQFWKLRTKTFLKDHLLSIDLFFCFFWMTSIVLYQQHIGWGLGKLYFNEICLEICNATGLETVYQHTQTRADGEFTFIRGEYCSQSDRIYVKHIMEIENLAHRSLRPSFTAGTVVSSGYFAFWSWKLEAKCYSATE